MPRCLVFLVLVVLAADLPAQEQLRIHGSNTIGERLAPELARGWLQAEGFTEVLTVERAAEEVELHARRGDLVRVVELHAHGSSTGFKGLAEDRAHVAMSSRPAQASDASGGGVGRLDSPQQEVVLALDGIALIVHPDNPLRELSKPQIRAVFSGRIDDWAQLGRRPGRIALHARDSRSGTWESFRMLVLGEAALSASASRYESTRQLAAAVAADPDAIGFVGLVGVQGVKPLAVADGGAAVAPAREEVAVEDYPLARRLYLYLPPQPTSLARSFVEFALSDAGQQLVEQSGFVSQNVRAYASVARTDAPDDYRRLVRGAQRLSLNFRFASGSASLDNKAQRDLDRLTQFMRQPDQHGRPLLLLGFSDADETLPYLALALSNERVDYVVERLTQRGVDPARARGMGGAAPVAANDSPLGRQRNRRVEVWLGPAGHPKALSDQRPVSAGGR